MDRITVAVAGGSGFIGRAIVRRLGDTARVRVLTRNPDAVRARLAGTGAEFVRADVTDAASLEAAMAGAEVAINAAQFDGYPIENARGGLTFERVDYGGTIAMIAAARKTGARRIIYISGAAADEQSRQPGFRAKGRDPRLGSRVHHLSPRSGLWSRRPGDQPAGERDQILTGHRDSRDR